MKQWKMILLFFALGGVVVYFAVDFINQRHISEQREFTGKEKIGRYTASLLQREKENIIIISRLNTQVLTKK